MGPRPLAGLASLVLVAVALVALHPDCASACSCAGLPGSQREVAKRALSNSAAVFPGKVAEIDWPFLPLISSTAPV